MQQGQDSWWQSWAPGRGAAAGMATPLSGDTVAPQHVPKSALAPKWSCGHLPGEAEGAALFPEGSRAQDRCPTIRQKKINLKKRWVDTKTLFCALPVCHSWEHPDSLKSILPRSIVSLGAHHLGNGNSCKQHKLWITLISLKCPFCCLMVKFSHVQQLKISWISYSIYQTNFILMRFTCTYINLTHLHEQFLIYKFIFQQSLQFLKLEAHFLVIKLN